MRRAADDRRRLHDLACRAVSAIGEQRPVWVDLALQPGGLEALIAQKATGRLRRTTDWASARLHPICDFQQDRMSIDIWRGGAASPSPGWSVNSGGPGSEGPGLEAKGGAGRASGSRTRDLFVQAARIVILSGSH
jgi:hypothetical protein